VAYTWAGWEIAVLAAYGFVECGGGTKKLNGYLAAGIDWTSLLGYGFFLIIPCLYVAAPLSLLLLLTMVLEQVTSDAAPSQT